MEANIAIGIFAVSMLLSIDLAARLARRAVARRRLRRMHRMLLEAAL